jgi:hypothetical protein
VLSHERISVTLHELETHWSLEDLLDAHLTIQVFEQLEREKLARQEQMMPRRARW